MYLQDEGFLNKELIIDKREDLKGPVHVGEGITNFQMAKRLRVKMPL